MIEIFVYGKGAQTTHKMINEEYVIARFFSLPAMYRQFSQKFQGGYIKFIMMRMMPFLVCVCARLLNSLFSRDTASEREIDGLRYEKKKKQQASLYTRKEICRHTMDLTSVMRKNLNRVIFYVLWDAFLYGVRDLFNVHRLLGCCDLQNCVRIKKKHTREKVTGKLIFHFDDRRKEKKISLKIFQIYFPP